MKSFPNHTQLDTMDCGSTCLRMVAKYYGKTFSNQFLRERSFITREGVSMLGISEAAEYIGFRTNGVKISLAQLLEAPLPCILHWNQNHFVVLYKVKKRSSFRPKGEISSKHNEISPVGRNDCKTKFYISDPAGSKDTLKIKCWASTKPFFNIKSWREKPKENKYLRFNSYFFSNILLKKTISSFSEVIYSLS